MDGRLTPHLSCPCFAKTMRLITSGPNKMIRSILKSGHRGVLKNSDLTIRFIFFTLYEHFSFGDKA